MNKKEMEKLVMDLHIFKKQHDIEMEMSEYNQIQEAIDIIDSFIEGIE